MLNALARWYVSRSLDCDRPLPKWVEQRLGRDADLREFHRRSKLLIQRLRTANPNPVQSDLVGRFAAHGTTFRSRRVLGALAVAALILIVVWPLFGLRNEQEVAVTPEPKANQGADVASDELQLEALAISGSELLSNWNDRAAQLAEPIADPLEDASNWLAIFDSDPDAIAEQLANQMIAPTSELGSRYGQFLSDVDGQIASNNRRMISDSVSTWRSLLRTAPERIAAFSWTIP